MIAKNIKGKSFAGCVRYVMKSDAEVLKTEGVMAMSKEDMITSFELQRSVRSEIKSPAGHIPISFAPEDKGRITNDFMVQLAEEYMHEMGIRDTQYIVVRHHDSDNEHMHIVYNRIDNNGKLISDKNDYKRNVATCKKLKDRHGLTYGKGKDRVKREHLHGADEAKYKIYDAIKVEVLRSANFRELQENLRAHNIKVLPKYRSGTEELQGISFSLGEYKFKGSEIDRKYSCGNLRKLFAERRNHRFGRKIPQKLGGVSLTQLQRIDLDHGKAIFIEGIIDKKGGVYDLWVHWSEQQGVLKFNKKQPQGVEVGETSLHAVAPAPTPSPSQDNSLVNSIASGLGSLLDLPADGADDPEEEALRKRMQTPKKKRGRRM